MDLDTDIIKCNRCMKEWEIYEYQIKYKIRKCNLCHRPVCIDCMKDEKNKRLCLICDLHPHKRECYLCGWKPRGSSYKRLINLHKHLNVFHYNKLGMFRKKEDYTYWNFPN